MPVEIIADLDRSLLQMRSGLLVDRIASIARNRDERVF